MRVYGRIPASPGAPPTLWVVIETDANGYNDNCYFTALCQAIKLNIGESPFSANTGIPQIQTIMTQVFPDYYMSQIQTQYAAYFASLVISRAPGSFPPQYNVQAVAHSGAILTTTIAT